MISKNIDETKKIAEDFRNKILSNPNNDQAVIVGLFGDLGSGKTTFSQSLGKLLGVQEVMTSPTFVIMKKYLLTSQTENQNKFSTLIHVDAYRLESGRELLSLDFNKEMKNPQNLILIEWPERVAEILPPDLIKIYFKFINENEREIIF